MKPNTSTTSRWERFWTGPFWIKLTVCLAVGFMLGTLLAVVVNTASSDASPATHSRSVKCPPDDKPKACERRWHAYKFRHKDSIRHSHGMPVQKLFKHPAKARKIFIKKISHKMHRADRMAGRRIASRTFYRRSATSAYDHIANDMTCGIERADYPWYFMSPSICRIGSIDHKKLHWMTADEIWTFGAAALCAGGAVAVGVSAPATGGASAYVAAGFGGASCIWGLASGLSH